MDKNVTASYIRDRFDPADRIAIVVIDRNVNPANVTQRITTAERAMSPEYQSWLRYENAQRRDVYIGMNPLHETSRYRMKEDIREVKHVYLDFDDDAVKRVNDMMGVNVEVKQKYEMPIPHAILNTSPSRMEDGILKPPKYQVVWSVQGFSQIQAEAFMRQAAREFGADIAATDSARILRLPGLNNWKRERFTVTVQSREGRPYLPGHFPTFPDREIPISSSRSVTGRQSIGGVITQSEKDFAFACGELEKGISPSRVVAALELRRPDKPNPAYYARHTVESAQRKVQSRETISR